MPLGLVAERQWNPNRGFTAVLAPGLCPLGAAAHLGLDHEGDGDLGASGRVSRRVRKAEREA